MFDFLHTYQPEPLAFAIGSFAIHWYGFFAALGLIAAWVTIDILAKKYTLTVDLFPLFMGSTIFGLIGARMYHVLNELTFYSEHPSLILQVWNGGLAFHGGVLGALLFGLYWIKKHKISFGKLADIFVTGGILIQICGRFGNYFNQELFGKPTELPWGIPIIAERRPEAYQSYTYFHPTFLYEILFNLILFVLLISLHRLSLHGKIKLPEGTLFFVYLLGYSAVRIFIEFFRIDRTPIFAGIRLPIIVSTVVIVALTLYLLYAKKDNRNHHSS